MQDQIDKGGRDQDRAVFPHGDKGQREEFIWKYPFNRRKRAIKEVAWTHSEPATQAWSSLFCYYCQRRCTHDQEWMAPRRQQMELESGLVRQSLKDKSFTQLCMG